MSHAQQHKIRNVYCVRNLFLPKLCKILADHALRGSNPHAANHLSGESSAQIRRLDAHRKRHRGWSFGRKRRVERVQRNVVNRSDFTCDAVVIHRVDTVGRDVHIEQRRVRVARSIVQLKDSFHGDATEGQVFGELVVIDIENGQVGAEPMRKDLHG